MSVQKSKNDERFYFGVAGLVIFTLTVVGIIFDKKKEVFA